MKEYSHPWQEGPAELIEYALNLHKRKADDDNEKSSNQRISFLILDVGVETLFKVYLRLPNRQTKTDIPYNDRSKAIRGSFYDLVEGVLLATKKLKLDNHELDHVLYYHNVRNKLYHDSDSITITSDKVYDYARIAVKLLNMLLEFDLSDLLHDDKHDGEEYAKIQQDMQEIMTLHNQINNLLENIIERIDYRFILPSFQRSYEMLEYGEPRVTLKEVFSFIEEKFNVDLDNHISKEDQTIVNAEMKRNKQDPNDNLPLKCRVIDIFSGFVDWDAIRFSNIPIGDLSVNSLYVSDFLHNDFYKLYLKIAFEAVNDYSFYRDKAEYGYFIASSMVRETRTYDGSDFQSISNIATILRETFAKLKIFTETESVTFRKI